jgi:hypothetical protein
MNSFLQIITAPVVYPVKGMCLFVKHIGLGLGMLLASFGKGLLALLQLLFRCIRIPFEVFWAILTWPFKAVFDRYSNKIEMTIPSDLLRGVGKKRKK